MKILSIVIKILSKVVILSFVGLLLFIQINIWMAPDLKNQKSVRKDIVSNLNFIETELKQNNLGKRMQQMYPEGYFFSYCVYGLTWCNVAYKNDNLKIKERAYKEALFAYEKLKSKECTVVFEENLYPKFGAFYSGWKNLLMANIIRTFDVSQELIDEFETETAILVDAFKQQDFPFIQTYSNECWPADSFSAIASVGLHEQLLKPKYKVFLEEYIDRIMKYEDAQGLIPNLFHWSSKSLLQETRGASMGMSIVFINDVDKEYASKLFSRFNKHFGIKRLGLPAYREFLKKSQLTSDVDSGPVLFDVGFVTTITSKIFHMQQGDFKTAQIMTDYLNGIGFSITINGKKQYAFGALPVGDLFVSWSRSFALLENPDKTVTKFGSLILFTKLIQLTVFSLIGVLFYSYRKLKKMKDR